MLFDFQVVKYVQSSENVTISTSVENIAVEVDDGMKVPQFLQK